MTFEDFKSKLNEAKTEEEVKSIYAKYFNILYNTSDKHDLFTPNVLFEFKRDKNFSNIKALAIVIAQTLCYIHKLKFQDTEKPIPFFICIADVNEAAITETRKWSSYYSNDNYDWERPASKPDPKLVDHIVKEPEINNIHVYKILQKGDHQAFKKNLENILSPQLKMDFGDKKIINEENFEAVFDHWKYIIGKYIINGYKESYYFLSNIQRDKVIIDKENNKVVFTFEDRNSKTQKVLMKDYDYFWNIYEYVKKPEIINGIHTKLDRLTDESQRRFEGEFYTPLIFCKKAIHYFNQILGKDWYKTGKYRIWDMAAGTGNLEYHLPAESYKYLYLSTLHSSEADHLNKVFPNATCFQYDYLNDDIEYLFSKVELPFEPNWKLPKKLRDELCNPKLKWIVFINPPFATAQDAKTIGKSKKGVSKTKLETLMDKDKIGHAKRELFAQFMYRIGKEMPKNTFLGMFSTLKYLNAPDSVEFRNSFFNYCFKKGFVFHSKCFQGVTGDFPIAFMIWDLSKKGLLKTIEIDIADNRGENIGVKHLRLIERYEVLNYWFERPKNSNNYILPPLSNGLNIKEGNEDIRHRARPDFLASICSKGNDFQNSKYVVILSSPSVSAGAFSVIPENFEKSLVLFAVRKIPKPTWLNDRNQFLVPNKELNEDFVFDCIIWSLFSISNQTTSLRNIKYLNNNYQIINNFFPFLLKKIQKWDIKEVEFKQQIIKDKDRFVAEWVKNKNFSIESKNVLEIAEQVYKYFYENIHLMAIQKWKIEYWDAGWYQIRRCLEDHNLGSELLLKLTEAHNLLSKKILPSIHEYGFLDKDEVF